MSNNIKQTNFFKITTLILLVILASLAIFGYLVFKRAFSNPQKMLEEKAKVVKTLKLSKSYDFNISQDQEEMITINLLKAEISHLVTTESKPIVAQEGQKYLLLYLEVDNPLKQPIFMDLQNYFRIVSGEKTFASDFYNGQVEIPAISSKKDQLGFIIKETDTKAKLQIGEIEGDKQILELKLD